MIVQNVIVHYTNQIIDKKNFTVIIIDSDLVDKNTSVFTYKNSLYEPTENN